MILMFNISFMPGSMVAIAGGMKGKKTPTFLYITDQLKYKLGSEQEKLQIFKPACDYREELNREFGFPRNYIVSRTGWGVPAVEFDDEDPDDLLRKEDQSAQVKGITEATLVKKPQRLVEIINGWLDQGQMVIIDGCDKDYLGRPWHPMPTLMALSRVVIKTYGTCDIHGCNKDGEYSQRMNNGKPVNWETQLHEVGTGYEIRCLEHFVKPEKK